MPVFKYCSAAVADVIGPLVVELGHKDKPNNTFAIIH